jgi:hypothetical protein
MFNLVPLFVKIFLFACLLLFYMVTWWCGKRLVNFGILMTIMTEVFYVTVKQASAVSLQIHAFRLFMITLELSFSAV